MIEEPHGAATTSRHFSDYLAYYRAEIIEKVTRLPEAELRKSRVPSGWTLIELVSHLVHMEQRWFVWGFLGEDIESPWGDWSVDDDPWAEGVDARWQVPESTTLIDLTDALTAVGERTTEILDGHSLRESAQPGPRWPGAVEDLRWICFHVLAEYARHAGHLDIAIELAGRDRDR
ncbi:MAG: DinB family protein [Nocardioides sp.]|nr:DinB family protein [Nocardioides sp.]